MTMYRDWDMDLDGLHYDWDRTGEKAGTCAGCGKPINHDPSSSEVPLILFKGEGKAMACLYFHSDCGQKRVRPNVWSLVE